MPARTIAVPTIQLNRYVVLALVVAVAILFVWHPWAGGEESLEGETQLAFTGQSIPETLEEKLATYPAYTELKPTDFGKIDRNESDVFGFTLAEGDSSDVPEASQASLEALQQGMRYFNKHDIPTGFLMMDIGTGRGFAYNIDEKIYGASTIKAPICAQIVMDKVETGKFALDDTLRSGEMVGPSEFEFTGRDTIEHLVSETIIKSENSTFRALRLDFKEDSLRSWLDSLGVESSLVFDADHTYPKYTVRDAARMWSAMYDYMESGSETAEWLSELFASTEISFIREALEDEVAEQQAAEAAAAEAAKIDEHGQYHDTGSVAIAAQSDGEQAGDASVEENADANATAEPIGSDLLVRNKGGWYAATQMDYSSMSDNAIVTLNGRDYLVCILTQGSYDDATTGYMHDLVRAVFGLRNDLVS